VTSDGSLPFFSQNWLLWQRSLKYRKKGVRKRGPDRLSAPKAVSFGERIVKIDPVDFEIIVLRVIINRDKKRKKEKNLMQAKYITRSASVPRG